MSDTAAEPAGPSADEPEPEAKAERIPLPQKLGYASGVLADNLIMNGFAALVLPVYNIGLAVNPCCSAGRWASRGCSTPSRIR